MLLLFYFHVASPAFWVESLGRRPPVSGEPVSGEPVCLRGASGQGWAGQPGMAGGGRSPEAGLHPWGGLYSTTKQGCCGPTAFASVEDLVPGGEGGTWTLSTRCPSDLGSQALPPVRGPRGRSRLPCHRAPGGD